VSREIERQWVGTRGPKFGEISSIASATIAITQYYIVITKFDETRFRHAIIEMPGKPAEHRYVKTIKTGTGLSRVENERQSTAREYETNKHVMVPGSKEITKTRYEIPISRLGIESDIIATIDIYPELERCIVIEIEFHGENAANAFSFPEQFKELAMELVDVTDDARWKNKNIALFGFPA